MTTCVPSVVYGLGVTKPGPACAGRRNGAWTTQAGRYNPENLAPQKFLARYLSTICSPLFAGLDPIVAGQRQPKRLQRHGHRITSVSPCLASQNGAGFAAKPAQSPA